MGQVVTIPYKPRELQAQIHASLKRRSVLVSHRRFGKTVLCINALIRAAVECTKERPRFAYMAPLYKQAKDVAWDYLKYYTQPIPGREVNEAELRVDLPGGRRVRLYGADNPDALRGVYLDGVVLDEYAQMRPRLWSEILIPCLSDRDGWAIFIGTPKGRNAFWEIYDAARKNPDWYAAMYRASETGILSEAVLDDARAQMSEDEYEQEYECSFLAALAGAYYGKQMAAADKDGRIGRVPWDPAYPVITAWDLGIGDATSIWFVQLVGREVRVIDFYEATGVGAEHYVKVLRERPYTYKDTILPHDADADEWGTGRSRLSTLDSLGARDLRVLPRTPVEDGINAARNLLPRCYFDADKCEIGIEHLRQYRAEWDEKMNTFKPRPRHDEHSHGADAFRYLAMGLPDVVDYGDEHDFHAERAEYDRNAISGY